MDINKHIISVLLANEPGVLSRVAGLFSARGYNIESLTVAATNNPKLSRITIVTKGKDKQAEQIIKQLNKLIDVVDAVDLVSGKHIDCEVLLVKVICSSDKVQFMQLVQSYEAEILANQQDLHIIRITASGNDIDEFILALEKVSDIKEIARSGTISLECGDVDLTI